MDTRETIREACRSLAERISAYLWNPDLASTNFAPTFAAGRRTSSMLHTLTALEDAGRELLPLPVPVPDAPMTEEQEAQEACDRA